MSVFFSLFNLTWHFDVRNIICTIDILDLLALLQKRSKSEYHWQAFMCQKELKQNNVTCIMGRVPCTDHFLHFQEKIILSLCSVFLLVKDVKICIEVHQSVTWHKFRFTCVNWFCHFYCWCDCAFVVQIWLGQSRLVGFSFSPCIILQLAVFVMQMHVNN